MLKIGFIGTGNMATALIRAIKTDKKYVIIASNKSNSKINKAKKELKIKTTNNKDLVKKSNIIFLCVKPKDMSEVLREIKSSVRNKIIVSIAAGIKISSIEKIIGKNRKIVRVMPNINCVVGEMAAAYSVNKNIKRNDKNIINKILNKAGIALEIDENRMDAVTALSGSGPAFVAYLINNFTNSSIKYGLSKDVAYKLAIQTFFGTSKLLKETKIKPEELIKMVSSKKGTTVAGLEQFKKLKINQIIEKTIKASYKRSKELGK
ncbi:MAG: pyrroline-5-carboxylate reductase [Nanoarchaeota archaeon]|nr:pyrroline-5-carboxylate reductase [Nanoarchaeota archaeon]